MVSSDKRSNNLVVVQMVSKSSSWLFDRSRLMLENNGCFNDKMKVAVSEGVNPWCARELDISLSNSRAGFQPGAEISAGVEDCVPCAIAPKRERVCSSSSDLLIRSLR